MTRLAYIVRRPDGSVTPDLTLAVAMRRVRDHGRRLGPRYRLRERGSDPGPYREDFAETVDRLREHLRDEVEGAAWILDGERTPGTIGVRVVDVAPAIRETQGNARIDRIYTWVLDRFPGEIRSAGICVRKLIEGTTTWSQHSPWPAPDPGANAWDWFAPTFDRLLEQAAIVAKAADAGEIPVGLILAGDRAWSPDQGWHDSGAAFHPHVHIEGAPKRTGTPRSSCP